jgi:Putative zinc dependent peptidase (DUF5700)
LNKSTKYSFAILLFAINIISAQGNNPNFEFSGVDQFWEIVNTLEANREPSKSEWNKLFNTPGYKVLLNGEFKREFFEHNFSLVFKPSQKKKLEQAIKSRKNLHHLTHYIKIRDNKAKVKDQFKNLKRKDFNRLAIQRTLEYLPQKKVSIYPPVSFLIFESNGRGSSPIVVDLAASIEWDFISFLSHEFHHWYRSRNLQIKQHQIKSEDRDLVNALSMIEAEGIADMVDKKDWYTKPNKAISDYARRFIFDVQRTPQIIKKIDGALKKIIADNNQKKAQGKLIFSYLPQRGHTTGYFMARLILEKFSKRELTNCVGNPFKFILLYNKAAKKSGGRYPAFSNNSVNVIKELSAKYSI